MYRQHEGKKDCVPIGSAPPQYAFMGDSENIYGKYLKATYNAEKEGGWGTALVIMVLCWGFFLFVVNNVDVFSGESFANPANGAPKTASRYLLSVTGVPVAWASLFLFPLISFYLIGGMLPRGWERLNNLWARLHRWNLSWGRSARSKAEVALYFTSFERHAENVCVFDDRILVGVGEGRKEVPFSRIERVFFYDALFVLRSMEGGVFVDHIADIGTLGRVEKSDLVDFVAERVPDGVKVYDR